MRHREARCGWFGPARVPSIRERARFGLPPSSIGPLRHLVPPFLSIRALSRILTKLTRPLSRRRSGRQATVSEFWDSGRTIAATVRVSCGRYWGRNLRNTNWNEKIINRQDRFVATNPKEWENIPALTSEGRKEGRGAPVTSGKRKKKTDRVRVRFFCRAILKISSRSEWHGSSRHRRADGSARRTNRRPVLESEPPEDAWICPWEGDSGKSSLCIGASPTFMDLPFSWLTGRLLRLFAKKRGFSPKAREIKPR